MADIDQLSIQIETSATGADKNLASLAKGLNRLQSALNKIDVNTFSSKMHKVAESVNEIATSVNGINSKNLENLATVVNKVGRNIDSVARKAQKLNTAFDSIKASSQMDKLANDAKKVNDALGKKDSVNAENIAEGVKEVADSFQKTTVEAKKTSSVISDVFDGFARIYAFGGTIGSVTSVFGDAADKANKFLVNLYSFDPEEGIKDFLKLPTKILPVLGVVEDKVKSKIEGIKEAFSNMGKTAMGVFNKMGNFFAKIGQRFTFTLLRKAINAVIKDLNDAMVSLANFSGTTGREFNSAMSSMAASAKWLGASIVGAFAPLVSAISPYVDALISKLVEAIRVIGMFFAALTGKGTIAVANKGMTKFGASTEKAAKSAKKLESYLLGIDELNVFQKNDNDSGGSPYNWEEVDIPDWLKNLADKFRDILEKLLAPIKEAWDRTKNYVISGFKYMIGELGRLLKSIGRDFLEMWNEEATIRMLENIFRIIGDIEYTIGNLAKRFREAWDEGRVGLHIFEHIRDIFATLIQHVRNVTKYMRDWSDTLNFRPLLHTFDELLVSLNKVADFIGGVFEDVMKNIVFKYIKWMIEDGIPHLNHTIKSIIDAFDFSKIREDLIPLEEAIERVLESLDEGFVNAVGNVGKALAEWTNSKEFTEFIEDIAGILNRITPERIEKFFTALGYAILDIIKALAKFVHSNAFQNFLDKLLSWFDKASAKDMAKVISGIATAIAGFKFVAFVGTGFKNFLQFIAIAKVADLGSGFKKLSSAFSSLDKPMESLVKGANSLFKGFESVGSEIKVVTPAFSRLKGAFSDFDAHISNMGSKLSGFQKALIGIGAGVAEITLVSSAVKDLATGAENAGADIIKIIAGIGAAWVAFSIVFESTAVGAIIAGIVAIVAAIKGLVEAFEQVKAEELSAKTTYAFTLIQQKTTETTHTLSDFGESMREVGAELSETFAQMHDKFTIFDDASYSVQQTINTISGISLAMQSQRELTEHEIEELGKSFETLKNQLHDLINASYDYTIQSLLLDAEYAKSKGQSEEEVNRIYGERIANLEIQRQAEIDAADATVQASQDAAEKYNEAKNKRVEAEKNGSSEITQYIQEEANALDTLKQKSSEVVATYTSHGNATDEFGQKLEESKKKITDFSGALDLSAENIKWDSDDVSASFNSMSEALGSAVTDMQTEYEAMEKAAADHKRETAASWTGTKEALYEHLQNIDEQMAEYEKTYAGHLEYIEKDAVEGMGRIRTAMEDADLDPSKMQENMDAYVKAVFGTENENGFGAKIGKAIDGSVEEVIPITEKAVSQIVESMFNTTTIYSTLGGLPFEHTTTTLTDGWNTIIDNTVSELEESAKTKFSDTGRFMDEGAAEGVKKNSDLFIDALRKEAIEGHHQFENASGVASPSWKYAGASAQMMAGAKEGVDNNKALFIDAVEQAALEGVQKFGEIFTQEIPQVFNTLFTETLPIFFGIEMWQPIYDGFVENVLAVHFEALKLWLDEKLLELVGVDFWQPYLDTLMEEVFQVNFDNFRSWFTDEAMTPWWEEDLLPWFEVEKWNAEIIEPVDETIRTHIEDFIKFWQDKIKKWFQDDIDPWFKKERWNTYGTNMKDGMYEGFKGVVTSVGGVINGLIDVFNNGIKNIVDAINGLIDSFNSIATTLGLPSIGKLTAPSIARITIPSFYQGGFTPYGNPSSYSLFAAGENGIAEMIGTVGGRPAVAGGEEITGIKDAVNESGYRQEELLGQIINIAQALLNKDPVLIGDRQIAEANRRGEGLLGMAIIS